MHPLRDWALDAQTDQNTISDWFSHQEIIRPWVRLIGIWDKEDAETFGSYWSMSHNQTDKACTYRSVFGVLKKYVCYVYAFVGERGKKSVCVCLCAFVFTIKHDWYHKALPDTIKPFLHSYFLTPYFPWPRTFVNPYQFVLLFTLTNKSGTKRLSRAKEKTDLFTLVFS